MKNLISPRSTLHTFKQAFPALAAQVSAEKFLKAILDLGTDARMVPPGKR